MNIFGTKLEAEIKRRKVSYREASRQMGISHATLIGAVRGTRNIDLETAAAITKWLGVPLSDMITEPDPETQKRKSVVQDVQIVLDAAPQLEQVFVLASQELENGTLSLSDFKDIVEYAAFKIRIRREEAQQNEQKAMQEDD